MIRVGFHPKRTHRFRRRPTFLSPPRNASEAIRIADDLMLEVKGNGRGTLAHAVATLGVRDAAGGDARGE